MIRPWHIFGGYLVCVALALAAMFVVTEKAVQLDRAEQTSRLRAELEERISGALWTMDAEVSSLLSAELARPSKDFACTLPVTKGPAATGPVAQTDLGHHVWAEDDPLVLLRFRVDIDNNWQSPQCPPDVAKGKSQGATKNLQAAVALAEIRDVVDFRQLALGLPLPTDVRERLELADSLPLQSEQVVNNAYAPQREALANSSRRQQFGPNPEELQQQQMAAPLEFAGQNSRGSAGQGQYALPNPGDFRDNPRPQNTRGAAQTLARNTLIVRRLQAVQAILSADRSDAERWSNTLWIGDRLVLARMTIENDAAMILGVCLDWDQLSERLREKVSDAVPNVRLEPISDERDILKHRALATLPVRVVPPPIDETQLLSWSPIRLTLGLAWTFLSLATLAIGALLVGAVRLSERRASFVAAVTHELRSPLTTFQLYTEMLLGGMVRDNDRETYLSTLKAESERLAHLVENVLQYSRLERGRGPDRGQRTSVDEMMTRIEPRLRARLHPANLELVVVDESKNAALRTDPAAVEQILYNLVDNAAKYAADGEPPLVQVRWTQTPGQVVCEVRDHGSGVPPQARRQLFRPFSKTVREAAESAPGVGLGLALCRRLARQLGGSLDYVDPQQADSPQIGATFRLQLPAG